ncbi:hypothetical protein LB505_010697 [Fusarium chuoi]|nr:hypothetical protein LB505_010697 [Fusarium chuoi]
MDQIVKVGAVQAEPVWLDLEGSVDKTISLIEKAAADGVQVLGFPEVWIPGYPCHQQWRLDPRVHGQFYAPRLASNEANPTSCQESGYARRSRVQ